MMVVRREKMVVIIDKRGIWVYLPLLQVRLLGACC